jgi:hypothetical protein
MSAYTPLSFLDAAAGYNSRYINSVDRLFMSQDINWNVTFFCLIQDNEATTGQPQFQRKYYI